MNTTVPIERITTMIYLIRVQKVMLGRYLAELYDVQTKVLKQAVCRNIMLEKASYGRESKGRGGVRT